MIVNREVPLALAFLCLSFGGLFGDNRTANSQEATLVTTFGLARAIASKAMLIGHSCIAGFGLRASAKALCRMFLVRFVSSDKLRPRECLPSNWETDVSNVWYVCKMLRFTADLVPAEMLAKSLEPGRDVKFATVQLCCKCLCPQLFDLFAPVRVSRFSRGSSGGILWVHHSVHWVVGSYSLSRRRLQRFKAMVFQMALQAWAF